MCVCVRVFRAPQNSSKDDTSPGSRHKDDFGSDGDATSPTGLPSASPLLPLLAGSVGTAATATVSAADTVDTLQRIAL